ncbi:MAG TPA: phenylalanine--tRNA ligase subunit alpha [Actinomycetota bacterium]|nr:phenylalanine--tRNA ligase subunit alpha [Actinomycetota bacterium]
MDPREALRTLDEELARGLEALARAATLEELEAAQVEVLGRRSRWAAVQRSLGGLPPEDRRAVGRRANEVKEELERALAARRGELERAAEAALLERDRVDLTLPGRRPRPGGLHPLTIVEQEIVEVFTRMGYRVVEGPLVETDWYNFTALNIPPDHPARTEKDTIFLDVPGHPDLLLRTETSAMQIRAMERQPPPVYVIAPGRVFRHDTPDATHSPVFHQVEGLAVDEGISFADLKGTLLAFAKAVFGEETRVRMNPDYFPFVEPGAELEVSCFLCRGAGCRTCKGTGWIEMLGCGMVHPNVLRNVGYDPERYTGFAFGMGLERVTMVRYGIPDLRLFFEGDVRFLERFAGVGA